VVEVAEDGNRADVPEPLSLGWSSRWRVGDLLAQALMRPLWWLLIHLGLFLRGRHC